MKLHLGSGTVKLKDWQNVDLETPEADMHLDLREKLPFGDNLITHIYNEHFIEHITREEAVNLLKECYRVLKTDGVLRLSTPDLKYLAIAYLSRNITEWKNVSWQPGTPCFLINDAMRKWGHQFLYDAEELVKVLAEAGFNSVQFVNYGESSDSELVGLETRPFHKELIVEARKDDSGVPASYSINNGYSDEWVDKINASSLEQIGLYQKTSVEQSAEILSLQKKLADCLGHIEVLTTYISKIESENLLRGQRIIDMEAIFAQHSEQLAVRDQYTADLLNHIHGIEEEIVIRDQKTTDLLNHIRNVEEELVARNQHAEQELAVRNQNIIDLSNQINNTEQELAVRVQHIIDLNAHIHNLEADIMELRASWRRKLISSARGLIK